MPINHNLLIYIDNEPVDIGPLSNVGIFYSWSIEDPENFQNKQGSTSFGIDLPATQTNDRIFNSFHRPNVEDMSGTDAYKNWRTCSIRIGGVELMRGSALLQSASHTRVPGTYSINCYSQNGDWIINGQDITLWDCLNTTSHAFTVANVEASWDSFDSDEFHDYVYAPVRYRQPFQYADPETGTQRGTDDRVSIYMLRPSLSPYWMLIRGFRQLGYSISSQFMNIANYFRRFVMPWTWGDFFDINSQLAEGITFKAFGTLPPTPPTIDPLPGAFYTGPIPGTAPWSAWGSTLVAGTVYIKTGPIPGGGGTNYFQMPNNFPPNGFDNFALYSFDETTGTMQYIFNPPAAFIPYIGAVSSLAFTLSLYVGFSVYGSGGNCDIQLEIYNGATFVSSNSILPSGGPMTNHYPYSSGGGPGAGVYPRVSNEVTPTVYNFVVPGVAVGDVLKFRIKAVQTAGAAATVIIMQSGYLNATPSNLGVNQWQYDSLTQTFQNINGNITTAVWQPMFSTFQMTGMLIQLGNNVNFQYYDKFRSYNFLDMLAGLADDFNWTIDTDPINRVVTIEPTHDYTLPDGTRMPGYYTLQKYIDWSAKQDISKENTVMLYSEVQRQFDFQFKQDGSDGAQNIYGARYKGVYLNIVKSIWLNSVNNTNNEQGLTAGVPGSSRYMLPPRFPRGAVQHQNRFFSAVMHYKHATWNNIGTLLGGSPADNITPQLICIIPENINDSSASAITQTFEPKLAYYAGKQALYGTGGWRWIGDPQGRGLDAHGNSIPTYNDVSDALPGQALSVLRSIGFELPYMFAVDYSGWVGTPPGTMAPILTYCDQNINGVAKAGLMKTFFLKRLAIMRNGKMYKSWMKLNLGDIINWGHRNPIIINGATYLLVGIENYNPLSDDSCLCTFWKVESPEAVDLANMYPSSTSILTYPTSLAQFDLKYAPLMLFQSDLPQVG